MSKIQGLDESGSGQTPTKGAAMPSVDDMTGCGPASTPNDVTGHAGNLQSADEAKKL